MWLWKELKFHVELKYAKYGLTVNIQRGHCDVQRSEVASVLSVLYT